MPPVWSHDGRWIVFDSNRNGPWNIYRHAVDGSGTDETLYLGSSQFKNISDLTSDDRFLLFDQVDPGTGWDVWMLPLQGDRRPVPLLRTPANERLASLSPDGRWLAYNSDASGRSEIYVRPFQRPGEPYQVTTSGGFVGGFTQDGRRLMVVSLENEISECDVVPGPTFTTTPLRVLFKTRPDVSVIYPAWDASRFIAAIPQGSAVGGALLVELNWSAALAH
jgi:Tol biopolymer transport system component